MKPITVRLERYAPMHGWANRLLRVDLSEMRIWAQETAPTVPAYLGARGVAARLCWDEYYAVHGWDARNGWPTPERLAELDVEEVYEPMVEGAERVRQRSRKRVQRDLAL